MNNVNAFAYCIIGYEVCNTDNIHQYAFDLINHDYIMIGRNLDYGVDIIKLDNLMIKAIISHNFEKTYKIIQVIKEAYASEINNMMYNVPEIMLKPQIYFGLKDVNSTSTIYELDCRYEVLPF